MGTAERRLEIMKLLCKRRHETIPALAEEFNVSVRTIQRDINELTFLMPLYVRSGRYNGGVYVDENYIMDKMYMTAQEIELLTKVKEMTKKKNSKKENNLFEHIIKSYTKPFIKNF